MSRDLSGPAGIAFLATVLCVGTWAAADGLLYQLPPDGSWVRFRAAMTMQHGQEGQAAATEESAKLTMRSVGQETVDDQKCRWIEFELVADKLAEGQNGPHGPQHIICKLLLPEENLQKGKEPLERIIKGWVKEEDAQPQEVKDSTSPRLGPVPAFLSGPLNDQKQLEKTTIATKLGQLECEGTSGSKDYKQGEMVTTVQFETRLNDKAPFGVVGSKMHYDTHRGEHSDKGILKLELDDTGKNATSSLPEHK